MRTQLFQDFFQLLPHELPMRVAEAQQMHIGAVIGLTYAQTGRIVMILRFVPVVRRGTTE